MTTERLHNLLVAHKRHPHPATFGQLTEGYAARGCRACEQSGALRCWCSGEVGERFPGDSDGLGCLVNVNHDWRGEQP